MEKSKKNFRKNKRGISIMIGYVLLITIAIIISVVVYQWIRTYVPKDVIECDEGVSLLLESYNYDCDSQILEITLKNNGRFNLAGYFIRATNDSDQELAIIDLSPYSPVGKEQGGAILFGSTNSFETNDKINNSFYLSSSDIGQIYSIEIVPIRFQEEEGRERLVNCGDERIKKDLECTEEVIIESSCDGIWNPPEDVEVECDGGANCIMEDVGECTCENEYSPDGQGGCKKLVECLPGQDIGDVDGDGEITSDDAVLALNIQQGSAFEPNDFCCVDVDLDGDIDVVDSLKIAQIASGYKQTLGFCGEEGSIYNSCEAIKEFSANPEDGVYNIDPDGDGNPTEVYCDMSTNGGGWMLLDNFVSSLSEDSDPYGAAIGNSNIKGFSDLTSAGYTTYLTTIEYPGYYREQGYLQMYYSSTPIGYIEKTLPSYADEVFVKWGNWYVLSDNLIIGGTIVQNLSYSGASTYQGTYSPGDKIRFEEQGIVWVGEIWVR